MNDGAPKSYETEVQTDKNHTNTYTQKRNEVKRYNEQKSHFSV